eukprot:21534-Heterococcus_DN1.PRE.6
MAQSNCALLRMLTLNADIPKQVPAVAISQQRAHSEQTNNQAVSKHSNVVAAAALAAHPLTPQYAYAVIVQAIVVAAASEQHVRSSY